MNSWVIRSSSKAINSKSASSMASLQSSAALTQSSSDDSISPVYSPSFFSMVKTELYYDWEGDDPDIFERDLEKYIDWYNNVRIKRLLDGSSPVEYRLGRAA